MKAINFNHLNTSIYNNQECNCYLWSNEKWTLNSNSFYRFTDIEIQPQGWLFNKFYNTGDCVNYLGRKFICIRSHSSTIYPVNNQKYWHEYTSSIKNLKEGDIVGEYKTYHNLCLYSEDLSKNMNYDSVSKKIKDYQTRIKRKQATWSELKAYLNTLKPLKWLNNNLSIIKTQTRLHTNFSWLLHALVQTKKGDHSIQQFTRCHINKYFSFSSFVRIPTDESMTGTHFVALSINLNNYSSVSRFVAYFDLETGTIIKTSILNNNWVEIENPIHNLIQNFTPRIEEESKGIFRISIQGLCLADAYMDCRLHIPNEYLELYYYTEAQKSILANCIQFEETFEIKKPFKYIKSSETPMKSEAQYKFFTYNITGDFSELLYPFYFANSKDNLIIPLDETAYGIVGETIKFPDGAKFGELNEDKIIDNTLLSYNNSESAAKLSFDGKSHKLVTTINKNTRSKIVNNLTFNQAGTDNFGGLCHRM